MRGLFLPVGPTPGTQLQRCRQMRRRLQCLSDGAIVVIDERRDPPGELLGRLDKRKMANVVDRPKRSVWKVLCEPRHMRTYGSPVPTMSKVGL
jgi:hypothetical protein